MKLHSHICQLIVDADDTNALNHSDVILMAKSLEAFVIDAIVKFIKGQHEHGGRIVDRDLDLEIDQEHIDLFWYKEARKWQKGE